MTRDAVATRLMRTPVWVQALVVYALSRLLTLTIVASAAQHQGETPWNGPDGPSVIEYLNFWDAGWYERIWKDGYPAPLPLREDGSVAQNAWAFYPLYPWLVGALCSVTGLEFKTLAVITSVVCAGAASVVILYLFRKFADPAQALTGLAFFLVFPATATLMAGYAEAMAILFLATALCLIAERRYLLAIPAVVLMDITRPIGVGFSFFMLIHLLWRWLGPEPYPKREVVTSWTLGVLSCVAALLHPAFAWWKTGQFDAYTSTESAWTGHSDLFVQWIDRADHMAGPMGTVMFLALLVVGGVILFTEPGKAIGHVNRQFVLGYSVYLLLFFTPQTSTFRLLLPLFPLALVIARPSSWTLRWVVVVASALLQIWWVTALWSLGGSFNSPP